GRAERPAPRTPEARRQTRDYTRRGGVLPGDGAAPGSRPLDARRLPEYGHHIAIAQLTAAAQFHLAVHAHLTVGDHQLRLRPALEQVRELEELPQSDRGVTDGDGGRVGFTHGPIMAHRPDAAHHARA